MLNVCTGDAKMGQVKARFGIFIPAFEVCEHGIFACFGIRVNLRGHVDVASFLFVSACATLHAHLTLSLFLSCTSIAFWRLIY